METTTLTPQCLISTSTTYNQPAKEAFASQLSTLRRLATFNSLSSTFISIPKGLLAKHGFIYFNTNNSIVCEGCKFQIELSDANTDPIEKHINEARQCPFLDKQKEYYSKQGSIIPFTLPSNPIRNDHSYKTSSNSIHKNSERNDQISRNNIVISLQSILKFFTKQQLDKMQADSFSNWPHTTPNDQEMIRAGFTYTGIYDRTICISCNIVCHEWTQFDHPYQIHRLASPKCPFILEQERNFQREVLKPLPITTQPKNQATATTIDGAYTLLSRRYDSFKNWPHTDENPLPPIEKFVNAGFYYTGGNTIVRCFHCAGSLHNWKVDDTPEVEHARWFPECQYIRQYIGEDMYNTIQRKKRELEKSRRFPGNEDSTQTNQILWTDDEIQRMISARLDLPITAKLREEGYDRSVIRKAYEIQLKTRHNDFDNDNALRFACYILQKQIQIINGNEKIIIVPEKYIQSTTTNKNENNDGNESLTTANVLSGNQSVTDSTDNTIKNPMSIVESSQITDKADSNCIICLTTPRQVAALPCGHFSCCVACAHSLKLCPMCRKEVRSLIRVYV